MYACQEDYIEHILHRRCTRFYKVRGLLFAEAFCIACKSKSKDDWEKVYEIWSQRRKKWPLVFWTTKRFFIRLRLIFRLAHKIRHVSGGRRKKLLSRNIISIFELTL